MKKLDNHKIMIPVPSAVMGTVPRHIAMTGLVVSKEEDGIISMMAMVKISFGYL